MSTPNQTDSGDGESSHYLLEAIIAYAAFCAITLLSRFVPAALPLAVLAGIAFPLIWGKLRGGWAGMGFTKQNTGPALGWGVLAGVATSVIGFFTVKERTLAPDLWRQLVIGVPIWLLLAVPFQEFFFRGWLQPRYEETLGRWVGLLVATVGFTLWHFCLPLAASPAGDSTFPIYSLPGIAATFGAGLIYGYSFQRTRSILTPWLAHTMAGIMFVAVGAASFVQP